MNVEEVLHMNQGAGETSYALNSAIQAQVSQVVWPIVEKAILDLYTTTLPESLGIADLGCSSGSNSLGVIAGMIDAIYGKSHQLQHLAPEFHVFLNDLPGNDFNSVFKLLPDFYGKVRKETGDKFASCFIAAVPGSFYGRLFPSKSLHFVYSSYSLHWLSQTPFGLESEDGQPLNKGLIHISTRSPPCVLKAYLGQFQKDFSLFLKSRSKEIVDGGRMVLILESATSTDPMFEEHVTQWDLLEEALHDMVSQGIVDKKKIDSFNVPYFAPSQEVVESEIKREGSFIIEALEIFGTNFDVSNDNNDIVDKMTLDRIGEQASKGIRAISESLVANHFGEAIINPLFMRLGENLSNHISIEGLKISREKGQISSMVISMKKGIVKA